MENIYKELRENYEFKKGGRRITQKELSQIFNKDYYCTSLTHGAIRKLETGERNLKNVDEITAYAKFFNVTADYLLGIRKNAVVDENIAMIGETTGLNDKSIETLKYINSTHWNSEIIETLNYILQDRKIFADLMKWISIYIDNHYNTPITYNTTDHTYEQCGYITAKGEKGISFGREILDNKGNPGYEQIGVGIDILESHAMLKIQEILMNWKNEKKKDGD
mgnify:CR=1 FL=1